MYVDDVTREVTLASIDYADAGAPCGEGQGGPAPSLAGGRRVVAGRGGAQREQGLEAPFVARNSDLRLVKELFHAGLSRTSARLVAGRARRGSARRRLRAKFEVPTQPAGPFLLAPGPMPSYGDGVAYWALVGDASPPARHREDAPAAGDGEGSGRAWSAAVSTPPSGRSYAARLGALLGVAESGPIGEELSGGGGCSSSGSPTTIPW